MIKEEKISAYRIISHQFLTLARIEFEGAEDSMLGRSVEVFKQRNLPIRFLTLAGSTKEAKIVYLGVDLVGEDIGRGIIDELRALKKNRDFALVSQVSMVMVYGPHFGETPGVFGAAFSTLIRSGVFPIAMSASSSSVSWLFPSSQYKQAVETLHDAFEFPSTG